MARYDDDTQKFMEDVSGPSLKSQIAHQALGVAKDIAKGKHVGEIIAKRTIGSGTISMLTKEAGVSCLSLWRLLNEHYGDDWWDWEPETLWQTFQHDHSINPSEEIKNMVQALQVVAKTNAPFEHWHIFENVAHAFNESHVDFGQVQPLELDEAAWAWYVLKTIRPGQDVEDDVDGYIAACAKNAGVVYLPTDLFPKDSQSFLDKLGNDTELRDRVAAQWPSVVKEESPLGIQTQRLDEVRAYIAEKVNGGD